MRQTDDSLSLMERQNSMFLSGLRYSEKDQLPSCGEEDYYKTFNRESINSFSNVYRGEKYSKPIWNVRKLKN